VQVQKMKDAGVQLIITAMDTNGVINLAREVTKQNLNIPQYIQTGYDYDLIAQYGKEFEGSVVMVQFVPLEFDTKPPGMQAYLEWIAKVPGAKKGELSLAGWLNADLLYRGLALAGPDFTRQKVVDAINSLTAWSADGITPGIDWTLAHDREPKVACQAVVKIQGGAFVPQFTEPGKPFVCFDQADSALPAQPLRRAPSP
jgi:hypothetical protein